MLFTQGDRGASAVRLQRRSASPEPAQCPCPAALDFCGAQRSEFSTHAVCVPATFGAADPSQSSSTSRVPRMPIHLAQAVTARSAFASLSSTSGSSGNLLRVSLAIASAKSFPMRSISEIFTPMSAAVVWPFTFLRHSAPSHLCRWACHHSLHRPAYGRVGLVPQASPRLTPLMLASQSAWLRAFSGEYLAGDGRGLQFPGDDRLQGIIERA